MRRLSLLAITACIGAGCGGALAPTLRASDGQPTYQSGSFFGGSAGPYSGRWAPMAPVRTPLYQQARGANSWRSGTLRDIQAMGEIAELKPVRAEVCQWSVNFGLITIGLDDSSYKAAYLKALRDGGGVDAIVDVRADRMVMSVLVGLYTKYCTIIHATGVKLQEGNPMKLGPWKQ